MNHQSAAGILKLMPAFLAGLFPALYFDMDADPVLPLFPLLCSLIIFFHVVIKPKSRYRLRWITGLLMHLSVFLYALLLASIKKEISHAGHFSGLDSAGAFICIVNEEPLLKGNNFRFEVSMKEVLRNDSVFRVNGRCLVYLKRDTMPAPRYGDILLFRSIPVRVKPPANPGQFDFSRWLKNREIYHQVFIKPEQLSKLEHNQGNKLMELAINWRNDLLKSISDAGIEGRENAVLSALIIGQDDEIDQELMQSYSVTGVLHVLAVSGMHVGLIYAALKALLKFPGRKKQLKWIKAGFIILLLWFYAMITGLSPSVLRASMMLSFVIIGIGLLRSSGNLSILCASALSLFIVVSPSLIFSAGFQLSFLAVAGIMYLYKPVLNLYTPKTWLAMQVWSIIAVSLVAQLATFPLSLFYFHQFPNYFLLANLVVIPLSTIIIFGGIILLVLGFWPLVATVLGKVISFLILVLNTIITRLGDLPGAATEGIFLSFPAMFVLYGSIIALAAYFLSLRRTWFFLSIFLIITLAGIVLCEVVSAGKQSLGVVNYIPGHTLLRFIRSDRSIAFCDEKLIPDEQKRERTEGYHLLSRRVKADTIYSFQKAGQWFRWNEDLILRFPFIQFKDVRLLVLSPETNNLELSFDLVDYVLVQGNLTPPKVDWLNTDRVRSIVCDGSNSPWNVRKWKSLCLKEGIGFIDLSEKGALIFGSE